jgi:hypothetical protein
MIHDPTHDPIQDAVRGVRVRGKCARQRKHFAITIQIA